MHATTRLRGRYRWYINVPVAVDTTEGPAAVANNAVAHRWATTNMDDYCEDLLVWWKSIGGTGRCSQADHMNSDYQKRHSEFSAPVGMRVSCYYTPEHNVTRRIAVVLILITI